MRRGRGAPQVAQAPNSAPPPTLRVLCGAERLGAGFRRDAVRHHTREEGRNPPTRWSGRGMAPKFPDSVEELRAAGNERFRNGQYAEASALYGRALRVLQAQGSSNPEEESVLYSNRAACHLKDGNCRDCIKDCTSALVLIPFSIKPLLRRASAYEALEKYPMAYVDYKTVLQIDDSVTSALEGINRALCYLVLKQYKEAVKDCTEALKLDGKNVKAFYRRAQAHKALKDYKSSFADISNLLQIEPRNGPAQKLRQEVKQSLH
uniref:Translocase of outer mitochondrial membrane 34 n=1 Tax=Callithrix jacchus TaxID=9483 RepID=A0A8I3XE23_CALJA